MAAHSRCEMTFVPGVTTKTTIHDANAIETSSGKLNIIRPALIEFGLAGANGNESSVMKPKLFTATRSVNITERRHEQNAVRASVRGLHYQRQKTPEKWEK